MAMMLAVRTESLQQNRNTKQASLSHQLQESNCIDTVYAQMLHIMLCAVMELQNSLF